jgi:uncharacterized membrane protein
MNHDPRRGEEKETARVEAFSDGVFAIAITLLILEIKVPHGLGNALGAHLLEEWPSFFAFVTSFATIGIMWLNHHRMFTLLHRVDHSMLVLNALLLLGVTFVPFPTAVIADYLGHPGDRIAAQFYSASFVLIAIFFNVLWRYVSSPRRSPRLLRVAPDDPTVMAIHAQYRMGPIFYLVALGLAFWNAGASLSMNLLLALFFAIPPRRAEGRAQS